MSRVLEPASRRSPRREGPSVSLTRRFLSQATVSERQTTNAPAAHEDRNEPREGEPHATVTIPFLSCRVLRGYASGSSASRPPTAFRGRQITMHDNAIRREDEADSHGISMGCHGCHAPVTGAAVTPFRRCQGFCLPVRGGVTAVTAETEPFARTQASAHTHMCVKAFFQISRDTRDTPRGTSDIGRVRNSTPVEGVTAGFARSRDTRDTATVMGWSA